MNRSNEITELIADVKEQVQYLQELGVEYLHAEMPAAESWAVSTAAAAAPERFVPADIGIEPQNRNSTHRTRPAGRSRLAALPSLAHNTGALTRHRRRA